MSGNGLIIRIELSKSNIDRLHSQWYATLKLEEPGLHTVFLPTPIDTQPGTFVNVDPRFAEFLRAHGVPFRVIE